MVEQRRLADPRLADERQRRASARTRPRQGVVDLAPLQLTTEEHRGDSRPPMRARTGRDEN
jgi:hypothetical protein